MNSIRVIQPGFLSTVQDLGRFGYAHFGISASGAADALAFRAGNRLVGNAENAPAIEMTLNGGVFEFESDAVVALTGSDFDSARPLWTALELPAGAVLRCGRSRSGARCYLAVRGGIAVAKVLGSASVHLGTGLGGQPLRKDDVLPVGEEVAGGPLRQTARPPLAHGPLRVTPGPQVSWFGDELYSGAYKVAEESNRMGLRLHGPAIPTSGGQMITEGVALGAIQIPHGGQPIILFVEHQTTGGYPKPANVISADLWRLGQLRPRDEVYFEKVTLDQALALLRRQQAWLDSLA